MMAGILVGEYVASAIPWWTVFGGVVLLTLLLWRYGHVQSVMIGACFMVLGALLMDRQKESQSVEWPAQEVQYEAVVLSAPVEKPKTMAVDVLLTENGRRLTCYLYKDRRSRALQIGDGLWLQSRIQAGRTFVASWHWHRQQVSLKRLSPVDRTRLVFLRYRGRLLARLSDQHLSGEAYAVVAAMALGDKSALTKDLREIYSVTGTSHVLALSGLHLGIIYSLFSFFMVRLRWQTCCQLLTILGMWAFVFLVGLPVSAVRSATMLTVYALCALGHRSRMSLNILAFTAMLILAVNPQALFDVGFQLSFAAVAAILLLMPLFESALPIGYLQAHRVVRWVWGMVAVSCAAQIGVAPLVAYYFGRFSPLFLLTNFIVIPAAMLILYLSLLAWMVPSLAYLLINVVTTLNASLTWMAALPGVRIEGLHPSVLQTAMVYLVIIACYLLIRIAAPIAGWSPSRRGW